MRQPNFFHCLFRGILRSLRENSLFSLIISFHIFTKAFLKEMVLICSLVCTFICSFLNSLIYSSILPKLSSHSYWSVTCSVPGSGGSHRSGSPGTPLPRPWCPSSPALVPLSPGPGPSYCFHRGWADGTTLISMQQNYWLHLCLVNSPILSLSLPLIDVRKRKLSGDYSLPSSFMNLISFASANNI